MLRMLRWRAHSEGRGPWGSSDTVRRDQKVAGRAWAHAATVLGGGAVTAPRLVRGAPF